MWKRRWAQEEEGRGQSKEFYCVILGPFFAKALAKADDPGISAHKKWILVSSTRMTLFSGLLRHFTPRNDKALTRDTEYLLSQIPG
jgi:hypothetical protein